LSSGRIDAANGKSNMTRRWLFAPIAALTVFAGYLGLQLGQPVTETEIINKFAAMYVAEQNGAAHVTDCIATPNLRTDVRLVVRCTHPDGTVHLYYSGPRGELRDDTDLQEPQV
jgi:hypothetical protein